MKFLETSPIISINDISKIEKELNIVFPQDFISHYLSHNGGYPEKDTYRWSNGQSTVINTFYSLKYGGFGKIETTYKNLVLSEKYLPHETLPFAVDDGGNFFCISVRKMDYGNVYYFNNDHYSAGSDESTMSLLEETFQKFIDKLT